jgi:hypothetical protein
MQEVIDAIAQHGKTMMIKDQEKTFQFPKAVDLEETEAIFAIVLRNLAVANWMELLPEARSQMLQETEWLMQSDILSPGKQQQIRDRLQDLQPFTTY